MFRVICPNCSKSLKAPEERAGSRAKCPGCGTQFDLRPSAGPPTRKPDEDAGNVGDHDGTDRQKPVPGEATSDGSVAASGRLKWKWLTVMAAGFIGVAGIVGGVLVARSTPERPTFADLPQGQLAGEPDESVTAARDLAMSLLGSFDEPLKPITAGPGGLTLVNRTNEVSIDRQPWEPEGEPHKAASRKQGYLDDQGAFVAHGLAIEEYTPGRKATEAEYRDGKVHGTLRTWYPAGGPQTHREFEHGTPHGVDVAWYEDGTPRSSGRFVHGRPDGVFVRWHSGGAIMNRRIFVSGELDGEEYGHHTNGTQAFIRRFSKGAAGRTARGVVPERTAEVRAALCGR